jgi:hypothetical protein
LSAAASFTADLNAFNTRLNRGRCTALLASTRDTPEASGGTGGVRGMLLAVNGWVAQRSDFVTPFEALSRRDGALRGDRARSAHADRMSGGFHCERLQNPWHALCC